MITALCSIILLGASPSAEALEASSMTPTPLRLDAPALDLRAWEAKPLYLALADEGSAEPGAGDERSVRLGHLHRKLMIATATALLVTGALGDVVAINQPTLFGDGRCATGHPLFGSYGCGSLSTVHGISAVVSVTLYTATGTLGLALPNGVAFGRRPGAAWYGALNYVHFAGILAQPLLGIVARFPDVVGVPVSKRPDFSKTVRTVHIGIGYLTAASFLLATIFDQSE